MGLYLTEKHLKYKDGKDDHVSPFFIYHVNNKRTKVFCSLKVNNKNWCFDKKKVKSTDKKAGSKNRKIKSIPAIATNTISNEIRTWKLIFLSTKSPKIYFIN